MTRRTTTAHAERPALIARHRARSQAIVLTLASVMTAACAARGSAPGVSHAASQEAAPPPSAPAAEAAPAAATWPVAPTATDTLELLPARLQIVARLDLARLLPTFGGSAALREALPLGSSIEPAQWERLIAHSRLVWFGADLREPDGRGYPDRLLVFSGDFTNALAELPPAPPASTAPLAIGVAEPVWPEAFGPHHVLLGRDAWHRDARSAATDTGKRLQAPVELGSDTPSSSTPPAALELWAMVDELTVREWMGPFADAFLRPLVLQLDAIAALQVSIDPGAQLTTLRFAVHARDPARVAELQSALQTMLDSVRAELTDENQRALFGEPRAAIEGSHTHVSWSLPTALVAASGLRGLP